ncbi:MAG: CBS domain-containing protein [Gemmataceae bacterium]
MQVNEVMTPGVECTQPNATLQRVAQRMKELNIGTLPVCDDGGRLVGMVTDRDITVRAVADGRDPRTCLIREVMTPNIVYCFEDQDVAEAADLMMENQIRRLVVLNRDKKLIGIVSLGDLAVDTGDEHLVGSALEAVSEPAQPMR